MPLSIFVDALPFTEIQNNYSTWLPSMQLAELSPNIGYSSSLHWQLYCNKYPDERQTFLDWSKKPEKKKLVSYLASCLRLFDSFGIIGVFVKKALDRFVFRGNVFANIPFRFRGGFCETGKYLFWDKAIYEKEDIFLGYEVVSQDEGHISFDALLAKMNTALAGNNPNIMLITGFADEIGHRCSREGEYSKRLKPYMEYLGKVIDKYMEKYPDEDVLIVSDHGMSTINNRIDLRLDDKFGRQSEQSYIAYSDSCIMCIWSKDKALLEQISSYLQKRPEGHLLSDEERILYQVTDRNFGELIYILREGNVFCNSWFGKSLRRPNSDGEGMHGFWPEKKARDQMASLILLSKSRKLTKSTYNYKEAHELIWTVMKEG